MSAELLRPVYPPAAGDELWSLATCRACRRMVVMVEWGELGATKYDPFHTERRQIDRAVGVWLAGELVAGTVAMGSTLAELERAIPPTPEWGAGDGLVHRCPVSAEVRAEGLPEFAFLDSDDPEQAEAHHRLWLAITRWSAGHASDLTMHVIRIETEPADAGAWNVTLRSLRYRLMATARVPRALLESLDPAADSAIELAVHSAFVGLMRAVNQRRNKGGGR